MSYRPPLGLLVVAALLVFPACSPQTARLVEAAEVNPALGPLPETRLFVWLPDSVQLPESAYVGRLRSVITHEGPSTLDRLYPELRERANELGANTYKVAATCGSGAPCEVTVDLFVAGDAVLGREWSPLPADAVVVFGDLRADGETTEFKLNGEPVEVPPLHYGVHVAEGETTIRVGGLLGASVTLRGGEGRVPSFWSMTGFGVGPGPGRGPGISFNTCRVYPVDAALGDFLVAVLPRASL